MPIIGAIIAFISLALPAVISVTLSQDGNVAPYDLEMWLIGVFEFGPQSGTIEEFNDLYVGLLSINSVPFIIGFIGVLIGAILAVASGVFGIRRNFKKPIALLGGVLMVAFSLIFIIWLEAEASFFSGSTFIVIVESIPYTIYSKFNVGFGIITSIIGGIICIASAFLDRIPEKERKIQEIPKQPQVTTQRPVTTQTQARPSADVKYCPHCGSNVPGDFCPSCGQPFKPLVAQ